MPMGARARKRVPVETIRVFCTGTHLELKREGDKTPVLALSAQSVKCPTHLSDKTILRLVRAGYRLAMLKK